MIGLLFPSPRHDGVDMEVSYLLASRHRGRGLASETVGALLRRARGELGLARIVAETQAANAPSRRLLERLAFVAERRLVRFGAAQMFYAARLGRS